MADKWTALNTFWNSFGLVAYDENTVPDNAELPYITYSATVSDFDETVYLTASIWYESSSWTEVSQKADAIGDHIGGGVGAPYDTGRLWITKAVPFAQRMADETNTQIRRIVLQVTGEYQ